MVESTTITATTIFAPDRTQDFSSWQQIEQYIEQWFRSREQPELGQRLCTALQQHGRKRIWNLVKNPQRLKLLCFNWGLRPEALPKTQAELYQGFIEYICQSQESFELASEQRQQLQKQLAQLSLEAIELEPTPFRLRQEFVCRYLGRLDAEGSLFHLTLNLGWLHQVEVDTQEPHEVIYTFIHPTIVEYLAALAIDDGNFFLQRTSSNPDAPNANYRIFAPQWQPVFLFWLGRFDVEQFHKQNLIQSLVDFQDSCGGFYNYRAIFLAAAAIAQFPEYTRSDETLESVIQLRLHGSYSPIVTGAQAALEETDTQKAVLILERLLSTSEDEKTRISAAYCLGRIDSGNRTAIGALELLSTSEDEKTRISAAQYLGKIDNSNYTAIGALVGLLSTTQDQPIRRKAADALEEIGTGNHMAIQALELLLDDETIQDREIRYEAAKCLGKIDPGNNKAIRELVWLLETSQGGYIRWDAGKSSWEIGTDDSIGRDVAFWLEQIGIGSDTAIRELVRVLSTTPDDYIRFQAAHCLERIGSGNDTAIREVVELLSSTQERKIRREAASILERIGFGNPTARRELVRLRSTKDREIGREAAWLLWQIDPGGIHMPRRVLERQLATIEDDDDNRREAATILKASSAGERTAIPEVVRLAASRDKDIHRWAVICLERIGTGNDTVIREMVIREVMGLLTTTKDNYNRRWAANYLGDFGTGSDTAIRGLVGLLATSQDGGSSWQAVTNLERIGTGNPTAIQALEQLLSTHQDDYTRRDAARLLWKINPGNQTAIQALEQLLLTSQDRYIRCVAANYRGKIDPGNDVVIRGLVELVATAQDYDLTGWEAAKSLERIGAGNDTAIQGLVEVVLTTQDDYIRAIALNSLSKIKQTHQQHITLVELLHGNLQHPRIYQLIWECAYKLPYTDFYRAFNSTSSV